MFQLEAMPPQIGAHRLDRLRRVETATVGHFRHHGFMHPDLRAVIPDRRVAGTAVTVRIPGPDSAMLHHALGLVRPGDFLVIDRCGDGRHACWGGVVTFNAKHAGVVGAVVDGRATDFEEVRRRDFPLWCAGPSPITTKILGLGGALNVPVACGGVMVNPGDAILADESGILVLAPDEVDAVADEALARQAREPDLLARIEAGEKLGAISGATAKVTASS
jgi:4-hydroxy-4-methyl-2-oxoglutarate aldolase